MCRDIRVVTLQDGDFTPGTVMPFEHAVRRKATAVTDERRRRLALYKLRLDRRPQTAAILSGTTRLLTQRKATNTHRVTLLEDLNGLRLRHADSAAAVGQTIATAEAAVAATVEHIHDIRPTIGIDTT